MKLSDELKAALRAADGCEVVVSHTIMNSATGFICEFAFHAAIASVRIDSSTLGIR